MTENYTLSWSDFQKGTSETFKNLADDTDFLDVTLACDDGKSVQAHKIILSSASTVLKQIFTNHPHQHPLIYLKGIKHRYLEAIFRFIYVGEAVIEPEDLKGFIDTAVELNIKGLNNMVDKKEDNETLTTKKKNIEAKDEQYDEVSILESLTSSNEEGKSNTSESDLDRIEDIAEEKNILKLINVEKEISENQYEVKKKFVCTQCDYRSKNKAHLQKHILGVHEGVKYPCDLCGVQSTSLDNLKQHRRAKHGQKAYKCNYCSFDCDYKSTLKSHEQTCTK